MLRIVKNRLEMRKLWPPKVKGSRIQKIKPPSTTKVGFQTSNLKFVFLVAVFLLKVKDDL
jgi:hypothetical protein